MIYFIISFIFFILLFLGLMQRQQKSLKYLTEKINSQYNLQIAIQTQIAYLKKNQTLYQNQLKQIVTYQENEVYPFIADHISLKKQQALEEEYIQFLKQLGMHIIAYKTHLQAKAIHFFIQNLDRLPFIADVFTALLEWAVTYQDLKLAERTFAYFGKYQGQDMLKFGGLLLQPHIQNLLLQLYPLPGIKALLEPYHFYLPQAVDETQNFLSYQQKLAQYLPSDVLKTMTLK